MNGDACYVGWFLADDERRALLERFPPRFPKVVADHVTLCRQDDPQAALLVDEAARVIGHALDPEGVEALVVEIRGTVGRPDGGTYHLTWSIDVDAGRKAVHSNSVIARSAWATISPPIDIALRAGAWFSSRYI